MEKRYQEITLKEAQALHALGITNFEYSAWGQEWCVWSDIHYEVGPAGIRGWRYRVEVE